MKTVLNLLTATSLLIATTVYSDTIKTILFETIDSGAGSKYEKNNKQRLIEIYKQHDWKIFWGQHTNGTFPSPKLPEVDFQNYFIVIAIDEIRSSGGYTLEIKEITIDTALENRPFRITLQAEQPGSASTTTNALTRPYHIVRIKK
jgi:hypothetical protein